MKKKFLTMLLALGLAATFVTGTLAAELTPAKSANAQRNNYSRWSTPVTSYLYENQSGGLTRVEYIDQSVVVEEYDSSFTIRSSRVIAQDPDTSIWGGFYGGEQYNFLIFGIGNDEENDKNEVVRVIKYDKNWKRLGAGSLRGANTTFPFDAGSLRCAEYNGYLYIHTSHEMYASSDGVNHQANMTLAVEQKGMAVTVVDAGYASHSFNQFILVDTTGTIVTLDHGDAYPRSIVLSQSKKAAGRGDLQVLASANIRNFPGRIGANATGASVGGLVEMEDGYIAAYNYDGKGTGAAERSIYLSYISKGNVTNDGTKRTQVPDSNAAQTPMLVATSLTGGYLLWNGSADSTLSYTTYAKGGSVGTVRTAENAPLSDCQPIYHNGKIVWYTTTYDSPTPTFYTLDTAGVTSHPAKAGTSNPTPPAPTVPNPAPSVGGRMTSPNGTFSTGLAIKADGTLTGWGNGLTAWGTGGDMGPTALKGSYVSVSGSADECYLVKADGTLWYLGGYLAHAGVLETSPTAPMKLLDNVAQFVDGIARKKDGSVWGLTSMEAPNQVDENTKRDGYFYYITDNAKQITATDVGASGGMALKKDGTLWSWGDNSDGALGRVTREERWVTLGKVMDNVAYVSGTMAIRTDASLWSWGNNYFGGVGNGGSADQVTPVKILEDVTGCWQGGSDMTTTKFAMTKDGALYSWGYNSCSQLGYSQGNKTYGASASAGTAAIPYQTVPRRVDMEGVSSVYATDGTLVVLKQDGSLWGIGSNVNGECGVKDTNFIHSFVKIMDGVKRTQPEQPPKPTSGTFIDVEGTAYYYQPVQWAVGKGITSGTSQTTFSPDATCTREQIITFLWRGAGSPQPKSTSNPFVDVTPDMFGYNAILWAYGEGIITGDTFAPNSPCTRATAVDFMWRAAGRPSAPKASFSDVPAEYAEAVAWAVRKGISTGTSATTFSPNAICTRAQIATFLYQSTK